MNTVPPPTAGAPGALHALRRIARRLSPHQTAAPALSPGRDPDWDLRAPHHLWQAMHEHLDPGDGDEHAGALLCGIAKDASGNRLLARTFLPAEDGVDYVPGTTGYRALTPAFIRRATRLAAQEKLAYLAVHNHGGQHHVSFSSTDMASHERGYPALLDLLGGQLVGAVVVAGGPEGAVAGDLWLPGGDRVALRRTVVIGANTRVLRDRPTPPPATARAAQHRTSRLLGDAGVQRLAEATIGVVGAGGGGILAVEYLARLEVGHIIAIDPERVELTNLPRLPGARRSDAAAWLTAKDRPAALQRLGQRLSTRKVDLARRLVRRASSHTRFTGLADDVTAPGAAHLLTTCDFIVLAADTDSARHLVNAVVQQYLIPAVQVGVKAQPGEGDALSDLFAVSRPFAPAQGCLWCQGLIDPNKLAVELQPHDRRRAADYGTTDAAPAVVTLNALAVGAATTHLMLSLAGRHHATTAPGFRLHPLQPQARLTDPRRDPQCRHCGDGDSRLGRGDQRSLPVRFEGA